MVHLILYKQRTKKVNPSLLCLVFGEHKRPQRLALQCLTKSVKVRLSDILTRAIDLVSPGYGD